MGSHHIKKFGQGSRATAIIDSVGLLHLLIARMSVPAAGGDDVYSMQAKITGQASIVKALKKNYGTPQEISKEVETLLTLRALLAEMERKEAPKEVFNRKSFDELILRKMYVVPSFEIHNGPAGLFDYGPPACALKANVLLLWRQHFALEENMLEMECTNLTPSSVLETSGHVERFTDFMTRDEKTGECFRADKLLEDGIDTFLEKNPHMPSSEQEAHRIIQVGRRPQRFLVSIFPPLFVMMNIYNPTMISKRKLIIIELFNPEQKCGAEGERLDLS